MRLERILDLVYCKPWVILPSKHKAIQALVDSHLAGNPFPTFENEDEDDCGYVIVGNTAIIDVEGVILNKCSALETMCGAFSLQTFKQNLKTVAADENVLNIILNISSGGGTVTGVPEAADLIAAIAKTKDVYAYTDDCIASAAYWLASQCKGIFLSKSAEIGSIGVYLALLDVTAMYQQEGVKLELFKAGKFKAMGIPGKPLSDDEKSLLQAGVDKTYKQFVSYVSANRKLDTEIMQGQMFDADDAIKNGLADGVINDLNDLIAYLNK